MKSWIAVCFFVTCLTTSAADRKALDETIRMLSKEQAQLKYDAKEIPACVLQGLGRWTQTRFIIINWNESFPPVEDIRHTGDGQYRMLFFAKLSPDKTLLCFQNNTGIGAAYHGLVFVGQNKTCDVMYQFTFAGPVWSMEDLRSAIIENTRYQLERDRETGERQGGAETSKRRNPESTSSPKVAVAPRKQSISKEGVWRARLLDAAAIRIRHLNPMVMTYSVVRPQDIRQIWNEETSFSRGSSQFQQLNAIFRTISLAPATEADARSGDFRYWISGFDANGKQSVEVFVDGSIDYVVAGANVLSLERQEKMRRMLRSLVWEKRAQNQLARHDGTKPQSVRQSDYLSPSKQKRLTRSANTGDSAAALVLADYYAAVDKKPGVREHFLKLAVRSGSKTAYDALIAFYVQPGGIFRPHKALALRRDRFRRYASAPNIDDKTWAYQSALKFKHSTEADDAPQRRELLRIAAALGSRKAAQEIAESAQERVSRVSVSESN
jgi:hypothetical protein